MKKSRSCASIQTELAACAANAVDTTLPESVQHHLAACAECHRAFADLQSAAAIQFRTASTLPAPATNPNLHSWWTQHIVPHKTSPSIATFRWRPIFITAFALLAFLAVITYFLPHESTPPTTVAEARPTHIAPAAPPPLQSTLISLRHQVTSPGETLLPLENQAAPLTPYRVIDAHTQLAN